MISENIRRRMLYVGIGLETAVTTILIIVVIPSVRTDKSHHASPDYAVHFIWKIVFVQLLIFAALIWAIMVKQKEDRVIKELLVATGVILILLCLAIMDSASALMNQPDMQGEAILMFICATGDFIAGTLSLITRYFRQHKSISTDQNMINKGI